LGQKQPSKFVLSAEQLANREQAFKIYRDMGRRRSLGALARGMKTSWPRLR
jgi:hypothetical protein